MLWLNLSWCAFLISGGASAPAQSLVPTATPARGVADSTSVLTVDALTRMATFWTAFTKEPPAIRDTARALHAEAIPMTIGTFQVQLGVVDMIALATTYPSVAADLRHAGLTAQQWTSDRGALFQALLASNPQYGVSTSLPKTSSLAQNLALLKSNPQALQRLKATGMWLPIAEEGDAKDTTDASDGNKGGDLAP